MQKVVILNVTTSGVYTVGVVTSDEQKTVKFMTLDERTLTIFSKNSPTSKVGDELRHFHHLTIVT